MAFTRPKASQINFDVTNISDTLIRLNSGQTGSADKDVGIVIERGDDTNVAIIWDESADQFVLVNTTEDGSTSGNVTISSYAGLQADAIVYGSLNDGTTTLTATVAELNYVDGVTSNIQTQIDNISSSFTLAADSGTNDTFTTGETLTIAGGTGIDTTVSDNNISVAIDSTVATLTGTQTLENKTLRAPTFESGSNSPEFLETRYVNATQMDFVQLYTGGSSGSYYSQGEYQKVATITPDGDSQNYTFRLRMTATSASNYQIVEFTGALRSNTLPDLDFTSNYFEEHNGTRFIEPKLWTKETTTAGFILAFEYIHDQSLFGGVNVEANIIPRSDAQRANVAFNTTQDSEQSSIDAGFTGQNPTLIYANVSGTLEFGTQFRIEGTLKDNNELTITATDPTADRTITFPDATGTVSLITGTETLTNKTIDSASNTLTLDLSEGTLTGTTAEFNSALSDGSFATLAGSETLTNKTLTSPNINEAVALTSTATELNLLDGVTGIALGNANELVIVDSDGTGFTSSSTLSIDDGNNYIGINQTSPEVTLHMTGDGAQTAQIRMEQHNDTVDAPDVRTRRSRGTAASPSNLSAGDYLFRINAEAYQSGTYNTLGSIQLDTSSSDVSKGVIQFQTHDGSSLATRLQILDSGAVRFNSAYTFPTSDGSANQFLQTNGSGTITFESPTVSDISDLTATATELNYVDGVTSAIQTQLDAKLALAGGTMSGAIAMGTNKITGMGDPTANQDAATKAYVDTQTSSIVTTTDIAGDSGTDTVTLGSDTLTFSGTANEITTAVTDNTVTISLPDDVTIGSDLTVTGNLTVNGTTTTISTTNSVVSDSLIELNTGASSNTNDLGIVMERGSTGDNAIFAWDESADAFVMGTTTATGESNGNLTIASGELRLDTLRIDQSGTGLRMTNVGAFDNDGSDNFRIFATNDLQLKANGDSGGGLSIDVTNNDVTIDNDLRVSAGQFYYGGTAVTSTATELNLLDGVTGTLVTEAGTQTLTNKTLTAPVISTISNTGTLTLPTSTGTVALTSDIPTAVSELTNDSGYITGYTVTQSDVTAHQAALSITESQISDLQSYLTAETNDLTAAVTWANVPDANITQSSVTQHQAALSITESQISDLGSYITASSTDTLTNKTLGATTVAGNIIPDSDSAYDLGSSSLKFRDLYLSGSSLNLDAFSIETHANGITFNHSSNTTLLPVGGGAHTIVTLAGTETLTNKTLTNPTINAFTGTGNGTITGNLTVTSTVDADTYTTDGLTLVDNNILSSRSNDNINLIPSGTGTVTINGSAFPTGFGTDGYVLTTDGAGTLTWAEASGGGATAGHTIQNAGSNLTARAGLNFDGTFLIATDDSGNSQTDVTVSSALQTVAGITFPSGAVVGSSDTQTLSNKTIDSASNTLTLDLSEGTLTGTTAEFNTALSDDSFATLTNTVTLTNKTLTSPTITSASLTSPTVTTAVTLNAQADLRFADSDSSHYVGFKAPATVTANNIWTLPAEDGSNTQVLTTNGSGVLSWTDGGGGGGASTLGGLNDVTVSSIATNDLIVYTGSGFENKAKHEVVPTVDFTKRDGTQVLIELTNAYDTTTILGYMNDRVSQKYRMAFTDRSGTSHTTLQTGLDSVPELSNIRNIGGVPFNGSVDIDLPGVNIAGNQNTSGTAAIGTSVTVTANNTANETVYLTFVDGATGTQGIETDTGLTYNPSTGNLGASIFTGTATSAQYADLAEMYATDEKISAGTVVMFAGAGKVKPCNDENCRRVAGIVSTDPAYLMNSACEGVPLAISGRVPCRVIGPVEAGDLMVSAGNGMAKANNDAKSGTIIGKAIEENVDGESVIEILAMMM